MFLLKRFQDGLVASMFVYAIQGGIILSFRKRGEAPVLLKITRNPSRLSEAFRELKADSDPIHLHGFDHHEHDEPGNLCLGGDLTRGSYEDRLVFRVKFFYLNSTYREYDVPMSLKDMEWLIGLFNGFFDQN